MGTWSSGHGKFLKKDPRGWNEFMEHLTHVRAELTFGLPYHAERLIVLEKIQEEMIKDQDKTPETRILAPMILSAPLYKSNKNEAK